MDNKGYVMSGLAFLLIIPSIMLIFALVNMTNLDDSSNIMMGTETAFHISRDVERNIPILTKQTLKETTENIVQTGNPVSNSRLVIKNSLQAKINDLTSEYQNDTGVNIQCKICSVDSSLDPFELEINSTISVQKDSISYNRNIIQKVSIVGLKPTKMFTGETYEFNDIPDPLPFIKCKNYGGLKVNKGRIIYGSTLSNYLSKKSVENSTLYENSSSALYIKKCPFDPYISHGNSNKLQTLKNCIENGYYHESNDGACFLCRLEGKAICSHYGLETFIVPAGTKKRVTTAPCSIDHVIFNGDINGIYNGESVEYYSFFNNYFRIFLDNGHRTKYGIS
jgi:hypothetical protein